MTKKKTFKRFLVTSALPYANGPIHIGHLAGAYLPADIYVRYRRLKGDDVKFICGSDEHGVPITIRARQEGISPQELVDRYHSLNKKTFEDIGISFDIYHRTSDPLHHKTAQEFFLRLYEQGILEERETEQYYDPEAKMFLADRYIVGTCPKCGYEKAYGDQCEKCGTALSPDELINPKSAITGSTPIKKKSKHWFFPLNKYEDWLRKWILEEHAKDWKPNVVGQCRSWLDQGLKPRAVTRDLDWGVPVPLPDAKGKVLYVWFEAPIGYISATKALAQQEGFDWRDYWQDQETAIIHFIGKDNIVFHCIIFPAMLKAHGDFSPPENVPANEFMNLEGDKISTSRNWAIWVHEYLQDFPNEQDLLRYVLTRNMPELKDSEFTWRDFQTKVNTELVGNLGNFIHRALTLIHRYFNSEVPYNPRDFVYDWISESKKSVEESIETFRFRDALWTVMELAQKGNQLLSEEEPWRVIKNEPEKAGQTLSDAIQIVAALNILMQPFLPFTAEKLKQILNINSLSWDILSQKPLIPKGHKANKPKQLFRKITDEEVERQIKKLKGDMQTQEQKQQGQQPESKPLIDYEDFSKLDLRVAKVISAEKHPNADRLLVLKISLGTEERTIVAGIAQHYSPEELVGKNIVVVANLKPRKLRGIESQGMLLAAHDSGKVILLTTDKDASPGAPVS
ncbi:MAG: methionine--tRNA ligase [Chlorobi bacterium]|nr:methionine--tRNA ligase [Chlorobiota bacterium]